MSAEVEQRLLTIQAAPGMVLARPVHDKGRMVLCGAGTTLSDTLILRLILRGVRHIQVKGRPLPSSASLPLEDQLQALRRRFSLVRSSPVLAQIERVIERELTRQA